MTKPIILMLHGPKHSGKSTIAEYLFKKHKFQVFSFADRLKGICAEIYGEADYFHEAELKDVKHPSSSKTSRQILLSVGQAYRACDNDIWARLLVKDIEAYREFNPEVNIVIDDLRLPVEVDTIITNFHRNVFITRLDAPIVEPSEKTEIPLPDKYIDFVLKGVPGTGNYITLGDVEGLLTNIRELTSRR